MAFVICSLFLPLQYRRALFDNFPRPSSLGKLLARLTTIKSWTICSRRVSVGIAHGYSLRINRYFRPCSSLRRPRSFHDSVCSRKSTNCRTSKDCRILKSHAMVHWTVYSQWAIPACLRSFSWFEFKKVPTVFSSFDLDNALQTFQTYAMFSQLQQIKTYVFMTS